MSYASLRRLVIAAIVESRRPSPAVTEVNLDSLDAHLTASRKDSEYWSTKVPWPDRRVMTRLARLREAIG